MLKESAAPELLRAPSQAESEADVADVADAPASDIIVVNDEDGAAQATETKVKVSLKMGSVAAELSIAQDAVDSGNGYCGERFSCVAPHNAIERQIMPQNPHNAS